MIVIMRIWKCAETSLEVEQQETRGLKVSEGTCSAFKKLNTGPAMGRGQEPLVPTMAQDPQRALKWYPRLPAGGSP